MTDREALALLVGVRGISYGLRRALMTRTQSMAKAMSEPERFVDLLGKRNVEAIRRRMADAARELDAMREAGVRLLVESDEGYPELLRRIERPPHVLFIRGETDLNAEMSVAVVGTRDASEYGIRHTRRIAGELARRGACVVSGLALGIDTAAHTGTLDAGGRTIAVLGGAHDQLYPRANRGLAERIAAEGGSVITEYPMGRHPDKYSFLERNRIIVGLSRGVLVTDGPLQSGARNTANIALDEGRELCALPGDIDAPNSKLPHMLIAAGAHLAVSGADVIGAIKAAKRGEGRRPARLPPVEQETPRASAAPKRSKPGKPTPGKPTPDKPTPDKPMPDKPMPDKPTPDKPTPGKPTPDKPSLGDTFGEIGDADRAILRALSSGEQDFDTLAAMTGLSAGALGSQLMMLEINGYVRALPGRMFALA